jgi:predicted secreted Zn-dependent protease
MLLVSCTFFGKLSFGQNLSTYQITYFDIPPANEPYTVAQLLTYAPENCKRIRHNAGEGSLACSTTTLTTRPQTAMKGDLCATTNPGSTSNTIIFIPKFNYSDKALNDKMTPLVNAFITHEMGHYEIYAKVMPDLDREIKEIPPSKNCDDIKTQVQSILQKYGSLVRQLNGDYDRTTGGGKTQGVVYPILR